MIGAIRRELIETYNFRFVVKNFVSSTLKFRYRKTVLGFFWSLLAPMLHYLVIGFVFSHTMKGSIPNYITYMFAGATVYSLISTIILRAPGIFISNENYIKKIYIPKLVFVLDVVLVEVVNFLLALVTLAILGFVFGKLILSSALLFIPFSILLVIMFAVGIACFFSVAGVFFRDFSYIVPVVMQAAFFATPILYDISVIPEKFQVFIKMSPLYYYVEIFRIPIYSQQFPPVNYLLICVFLSLSVFLGGLFFLKKFDNKIVFKL